MKKKRSRFNNWLYITKKHCQETQVKYSRKYTKKEDEKDRSRFEKLLTIPIKTNKFCYELWFLVPLLQFWFCLLKNKRIFFFKIRESGTIFYNTHTFTFCYEKKKNYGNWLLAKKKNCKKKLNAEKNSSPTFLRSSFNVS